MSRLAILARIALALLIGAAGSLVFRWLSLPLPWMLGAMTFTLVAAVARAPIRGPERLRPPLIAVIGVLLGAGFKPEMLSQVASWSLTLFAMFLFLALTALVSMPLYLRFKGFDAVTAFLAAMPGGLIEMATLARSFGADDRRVLLAHAARIVLTIAMIGIWFRVIEGFAVGTNPGGTPLLTMGLRDLLVLALCGVIGAWLGIRLKLPAPTLLGPMVISGIAHLSGLTGSAPPAEIIILAQVVMGTTLGCRFIGVSAQEVGIALLQSTAVTLISMVIAVAFAFGTARLTGLMPDQVLLAFAPGGLTEMSLVAIAIQADVAFVALHHVVRIVLVVAAAPLVVRFLQRKG